MKNNKYLITKIITLVLGILMAIGPVTVFKACDSSEKIMRCTYTSRIEIGLGIFLAIISILELFSEETNWKYYFVNLLVGFFCILVPTFIIGGCMKKEMRCQMITFPCVYLIASVLILVNVIGLIKNGKNSRA